MYLVLDEMEMRLQWEHVDVSDYVQGDVEVVENQTQTVNMKNKKVRLFNIEIVERAFQNLRGCILLTPTPKSQIQRYWEETRFLLFYFNDLFAVSFLKT